jgi:acyl-CoA synthetase (AMP-forming)/AMP-acid ligase II
MKGHYRDAAAAASVIAEGSCAPATGAARCRRRPVLVGRGELIIRSGFNVYPPEVETALNAHPAVVQSAVDGRRVSGNEEVVAFVEAVPGAGLDAPTLQAFVAARLAPYKRPQHLFVVERMPASATGKIQKHALVTLAESLIAAGHAGGGTMP